MKRFWNWIDGFGIPVEKKYTVCLWLLGLMLALAGSVMYLLLALTVKLGLEWLLICTGWPVLLSWVGVFLYGCRHPFH